MMSVDTVVRCLVVCAMCTASYASVLFKRIVMGRRHPLDWPLDLEMLAAGFIASLYWGNLATLRLMLGIMVHPFMRFGLKIERIHPPGCESMWWLSLKQQHKATNSAKRQPDIVLCYVHGGAVVSGSPLMCAVTFERWMRAFSRHGLYVKVLGISYPLAPEQPFPAAVASTAAAFAWVGKQYPAGCGTTVIAVGDSAGGNITAASLAALKDYLRKEQQQQHEPAPDSAPAEGQGRVAGALPAVATPAAAATGSSTAGSSTTTSAATAAIEAKLFADLRNRLAAVMADVAPANQQDPIKTATFSSSSSSRTAAAAPLAAAAGDVCMPSAIILVSPAADISPTACFRRSSQAAAAAAGAGGGSGDNDSDSRPHYDYLPKNIESGGMGSYAEHHEELCGAYASPTHLCSFEGLCTGRWLVLAGCVELLAQDIHRFATKLQQSLGPDRVVYHVEPKLPHSWAILPTPSMATRQEVVVRFILAEHKAAAAAERAAADARLSG